MILAHRIALDPTVKQRRYFERAAGCDRKTCNRCGSVREHLSLAERVFRCDQCGHVQDRDVNASRNLCGLAKRLVPAACGEITPGDSGAVIPLVEPGTAPCTNSRSRTGKVESSAWFH